MDSNRATSLTLTLLFSVLYSSLSYPIFRKELPLRFQLLHLGLYQLQTLVAGFGVGTFGHPETYHSTGVAGYHDGYSLVSVNRA